MTELLFALGRIAGLGTAAGIRPALTMAAIGLMHNLHAGTTLNEPFAFLGHWITIVIFIFLGIVESALDKIAGVDRLQSRLSMPYRIVMGGVAAAATMPYGWWGVALGLVVGGSVSWFANFTKQRVRPRTLRSGASIILMSLWEDVASVVTTLVTLAFSPFGFLALGFTTVMYASNRYIYLAKYRKMRREAGTEHPLATESTHRKRRAR